MNGSEYFHVTFLCNSLPVKPRLLPESRYSLGTFVAICINDNTIKNAEITEANKSSAIIDEPNQNAKRIAKKNAGKFLNNLRLLNNPIFFDINFEN